MHGYDTNMEQFELGFETPVAPEERNIEELTAEYRRAVGVPPRTTDRAAILSALADPDTEIERLRTEDGEDDKQEIQKMYRSA